MGCSYEFGCKTCRKAYWIGSSSYSSWMTFDTLEEYDVAPGLHHRDGRDLKQYRINQDIRRLLGEHDGHEHLYALSDITHRHGKVLCQEMGFMGGECAVLAEDWGDWEHHDLEREAEKA